MSARKPVFTVLPAVLSSKKGEARRLILASIAVVWPLVVRLMGIANAEFRRCVVLIFFQLHKMLCFRAGR